MNCQYLLINRNIFGYSDVHVRLERIKRCLCSRKSLFLTRATTAVSGKRGGREVGTKIKQKRNFDERNICKLVYIFAWHEINSKTFGISRSRRKKQNQQQWPYGNYRHCLNNLLGTSTNRLIICHHVLKRSLRVVAYVTANECKVITSKFL